MKLFPLALVIATASSFAPQPVDRSRTSMAANKVPGFLEGIFNKKNANSDNVVSNSATTGSSVEMKKKQQQHKKKKQTATEFFITDFFNNFEPLHGKGSGEKELEEMKKTQDQILSERRTLDSLKDKYRNTELDHHGEIPMIAFDPKDLNQKEDDAMYVDENHSVQVPSFHIEEAADSLMEKMNNWVNKQANKKDISP
eukprot:scaffold3596_cov126-Cylindrotheca_fusiformis.AAC.11